MRPTESRVAGWRAALTANGIRDELPVVHGSFRRHDGYVAGRMILQRTPRVDAVFATSDEEAIGVIRAAHELGIRVPEELSVIGFDGMDAGAFHVPAVTTVAQPVARVAKAVLEQMTSQIRHGQHPDEHIRLKTTLVIRESCGCPAGTADTWRSQQAIKDEPPPPRGTQPPGEATQ